MKEREKIETTVLVANIFTCPNVADPTKKMRTIVMEDEEYEYTWNTTSEKDIPEKGATTFLSAIVAEAPYNVHNYEKKGVRVSNCTFTEKKKKNGKK